MTTKPKKQADEPAAPLTDPAAVAKALADPFPASVVGWKPQTAKNGRALAVAYIDARDVQDRLDAVVGIAGWKAEFMENADHTVACILSLKLGGEWISKQDVGGESEQKDAGDRKKAAYSDALKRAAVHWGVGRYLYSLPTVWADYDEQRRQFKGTPALPAWALPGGSGRPPGNEVRQPAAPHEEPAAEQPKESPGQEFLRKLTAYDEKLTAEGLIKGGDLIAYVAGQGKKAGHPADLTQWDAAQRDLARAETKHFEQQRRAALKRPA